MRSRAATTPRLHSLVPESPRRVRRGNTFHLVSGETSGQPQARELWIGIHLARPDSGLLERLATHAQRFTPRASLAPPDGVLLEVRGSLQLFGGALDLCRAVQNACAALEMPCVLALAPTPLAALAGARAGVSFVVTDARRLVSQLAPLPIAVLRWPPEVVERLVHIGVRTIGQVLRLPRTGFARRFGAAQLATLDQLTGRRADPQRPHRPRERFHVRCEPSYELEHHEGILATLAAPLAELEQFLRARQSGVTELSIRLHHRQAPATRCRLSLASPEADAKRLTALLAERLAALVLPEPVRRCELRSGTLVPRATPSGSLWQPGEHGGGAGSESPAFLERLRSRLGADAVYGLEMLAEHRPESAWRLTPSDTALARREKAHRQQAEGREGKRHCTAERPLWLLPNPRPLPERDGLPHERGALQLLSEPERIETGWWDGRGIARDYFIARDERGSRLWIYRERRPPHRWFLHGLFG